jgi:hypothetical protein
MKKAKVEIKTPGEWIEWNTSTRKAYMADVLRCMAYELENDIRTIHSREKLDRNGNTRAVEIRFVSP